MRTPPLLDDFIHTRGCKPICEKLLTLPIEAKFKLRSTDDVYSAAGKAEFRGEEPAEVGGAASAFSKY